MTEKEDQSKTLAVIEERWQRAWEHASEFERCRFRSLDTGDALHVMYLIPAGEAATLGDEVKMASWGFADLLAFVETGPSGTRTP